MPEAAYATEADFAEYVEGWVTDDPTALERLLRRASEDVDSVLGAHAIVESGTYAGRKIDPTTLTYSDARALRRATCAQAEYRHTLGERQFARPILRGVSGPDFSHESAIPHIAPKTWRELSGSDVLRNVVSSGRAASGRPPWFGFSYNDPEEP